MLTSTSKIVTASDWLRIGAKFADPKCRQRREALKFLRVTDAGELAFPARSVTTTEKVYVPSTPNDTGMVAWPPDTAPCWVEEVEPFVMVTTTFEPSGASVLIVTE